MRLLHNLLRDPNTALRGARKQQFQCTLTLRSKVMRELNAHVQACCNVRAKETAQWKHALMTCSAVLVPWHNAVQVVYSAFCAPAPCLLTARYSCAEVSYEL